MTKGSMFIKKELQITVEGNTAKLDQPLYLFQNDRFIDIYFSIVNFKFDFIRGIQTEENLVVSSNASYATIRVLKPNGQKVISEDLIPITDDNNKVLLTIKEDFMDEVDEIGVYKLQISLWDNNEGNEQGKVTLPYIEFEVLEPIFPEDFVANYVTGQVDITKIGMSRIANPDNAQVELQSRMNVVVATVVNDYYDTNLVDWVFGDIITSQRMNAIHYNINQLKDKGDVVASDIQQINNSINVINQRLDEGNTFDADNTIYLNDNRFTNVAQALDYLLYQPIEISNFVTDVDTYREAGNRITKCTFTWEYNKKNIISQQINDIVLDKDVRTYTHDTAFNKNKTFTLTVNDGVNTISKNINFIFDYKVYWGVSDIPSTYNSTFINQLSNSELSSTHKRTIVVNADANKYIYYVVPSSLGSCTFSCNGFIGGFVKVQNISFTNNYNVTTQYDIYKSENMNLGLTTIVVT